MVLTGKGWKTVTSRCCQVFSACLPSLESALSLQKKHCTLLHEGAHAKPEAVEKGEVVFYHIGAWVTRMGVIPLVRAEPVAGTRESSQT